MRSSIDLQSDLADAASSLDRHGVAKELRSRFVEYVASAPVTALWHANPRYLAEQVLSSERATLRMLLACVHEGLARLHWEVQCPKCGAVTHRGDTLTQMHREEK